MHLNFNNVQSPKSKQKKELAKRVLHDIAKTTA